MTTFTVVYIDEKSAYMQPDPLPVKTGYEIARGLSFDEGLKKMAEILHADEISLEQPAPVE